MPVGFGSFAANGILNALCNNTPFSIAQAFVQLHVGDPGANGTANVAVEADRVSASFGVSSGGAITNDAQLQWTNVAGSEDYTHFSLWDASSGGNLLLTGTMTANAVSTGDTFTIQVGDLDLALALAS